MPPIVCTLPWLTKPFYEASELRRVRISGFPSRYTTSEVLALVWGGRIERIIYVAGSPSAMVVFMVHEDCIKYFKATANGIAIPGEEGRYAEVELAGSKEPSHEYLRGCVQMGATRCVRVVGVDADWGMGGLTKLASKGNRKVERVINGTNLRSVSGDP